MPNSPRTSEDPAMNIPAPEPPATTAPAAPRPRHLAHVLWFPLFFVAAFATMALTSFTHPSPHHVSLGVAGTARQVAAVERTLDKAEPGGFDVRQVADAGAGRAEVARGDLAAVYVPDGGADGSELLVSSASGSTRATYLTHAVAPRLDAAAVHDVRHTASGDVSGTGLFSLFVHFLATGLDVLPGGHPLLLLYGFLFTQAIGWLTTAAALVARKHLLPIAMTFVLILGVPTSGGTVSGDMLPGFGRALHTVLPFARFLDLTRAEAYFGGHGAVAPLLALLGWAAAGAGALLGAELWTRRSARPKPEEALPPAKTPDSLPA
ncbi:hypothetical protein GA0115251_12743 [Streptomyces sp. TverLS-915]|uniref:hypothetical protein n=1 Tax=Streptomyces sp. TverLS-915 TaxID=1839763 RepID=UPI00081D761E|nr:hypothetical protein [Streptomyces sp. TverLS-915]SCD88712.1 hypothetical protein GA0115251_12743 [Streptomyces sp. TverLS-915]